MNIQCRFISLVAPVGLALACWLPSGVVATEFDEAQVTQVVQDVKVVPSNAAARPAAVNETVRTGSAVHTGAQSRSELTFKDKTITRLGEKTIFNVGQGSRTIEMGSGQFLLYVPKKAGGAQVKMGPVTAAITGTTVVGNVDPSGIVEFTVLEGSACLSYGGMGQTIFVQAGQLVVYDPIAMRLENPVDVDLQQQLNSPLINGYRQLPSAGLIQEEIQSRRQVAAPNGDLDRAVRATGAASIQTATPDQFMQAFNSLLVSYPASQVHTLVGGAVMVRPDLANQIRASAARVRPVRGYSKEGKDFKEYKGKEIAAPECPTTNQYPQPYVIPPQPQPTPPVSPEQPPTQGG